MSTKNILMIIGLMIYCIFICTEGMFQRKTTKTTEGLFSGNRGIGSFAMLCTLAMSMFSGLTYNGFPAAAYRTGIGYMSPVGGAIGQSIIIVILGYRLWLIGKKYGTSSPADYFRERYYSEGFGYFVAVLLCIFIIPYVAMQIIAVGDTIEVTTGIPYMVGVGVITLVIAIHCMAGGMSSVAFMAIFHAFLAYIALFLVFTGLIAGFDGGLKGIVQTTASNPETAKLLTWGGTGANGWKGTLANATTGSFVVIAWPHIFTRTFANKGKKNFKAQAIGIPIMMIIAYTMLVMIGAVIAPAYVGAGFAAPDRIMPTLATQYTPPFIAFMSMLCLCAFAISTVDSFFLVAAQFASKDIYMHLKYTQGKPVDEKTGVQIGRIVMFAVMVIMLFVVWIRPAGITDLAYKLASPFFAMVLPALVFGLYWRKATKEGAWAGTLSGLAVTTIFTFFVKPPLGLSALIWGLFVNFAMFFLVSLCTKAPEGIAKKFIDDIDDVVLYGNDFEEMVGRVIVE